MHFIHPAMKKTLPWRLGCFPRRISTSPSQRKLLPSVLSRHRQPEPQQRKRLVILGTGWGSYSLLKNVSKNLYDVIVISPRNHFLFTPLLTSTTVGTLEFRSITEPIRNTGFRDEHHFHLSYATGLDAEQQVVHCVSALDPSKKYDVSYDVLVIGVGAVPNDFNVPGVKEHGYFLKVCTYVGT